MSTPRRLALLALSIAPLLGCGGAKPAAQRDCQLEFLRKAPERPYEELGSILEHVMNVPAAGAIEAVRPKACAMGADAFIVEREQVLNYFGHTLVEGKAIRWTVAPAATPTAAPEPPVQPAPATPKPTP
jgi:hypothetical protein